MLTRAETELHGFWHWYEADIGFRSTFSAMLAAHAGVALGEGPPMGWDPYAEIVETISDGTRIYRALRRMHTADVVVLYRLYGPRRPSDEHEALGELGPLAPLTAAARQAREDIVLARSTPESERVAERVATQQDARRARLEEFFWREVGRLTKLEAKLPRARTAARQVEIARRIAEVRDILRAVVGAYQSDGVVRATIGAIESTDREVTLQDAVRARLAARDASFVAEVRREATAMRVAALEAYREACRAERREPHGALAGAA